MSQKSISLLLAFRCILAALKTVKNALTLPHCILKTMLVQPHKIKRFFPIVPEFHKLIRIYRCPCNLGVSWDVRITALFKACTWLISRQFKLKVSVKIQTWEGFAPQPHWGHREHNNPKSPASSQHFHFATVWGLATWPARKRARKILAMT